MGGNVVVKSDSGCHAVSAEGPAGQVIVVSWTFSLRLDGTGIEQQNHLLDDWDLGEWGYYYQLAVMEKSPNPGAGAHTAEAWALIGGVTDATELVKHTHGFTVM